MNYLFAVLASLIFISSCNSQQKQNDAEIILGKQVEEQLEAMNRKLMRDEGAQIDGFAERLNWPMITSGTGLRYWLYIDKEGEPAKKGEVARVEYIVSLLNGDTIYTSEKTGPREFLIGQDNVESGLHEGIQYMSIGDQAKFILPSHLAHGLSGDQDKIPPRYSVVYDIRLINLR